MAEFMMPSLGADMEAGTLVAWRKRPGELVRKGDIIAEVETEKGIIEVEAFTAGVLERTLVEPGTKVPVGTPLAILRDEAAGAPPKPPADSTRARASPAARKLALDLGVELTSVAGTGPGGSITRDDVERAARAREAPAPPAAAPVPASPPAALDAQARMRQAVAAAMTRSKREIPHYYMSHTIDFYPASSWLMRENERRPIEERLLPSVLLVKATALAVHEVPELNGRWENERASLSDRVHVGVAISLRHGGLVAPAIHDADRKPLSELMARLHDLVARTRAGTLRSSELSDPTITVTSLGDLGVETVFGVIHPPQLAIVGFGAVSERPWIIGGQIVLRPLVHASLSGDHRVSDGHRGARFLLTLARLLEEPDTL